MPISGGVANRGRMRLDDSNGWKHVEEERVEGQEAYRGETSVQEGTLIGRSRVVRSTHVDFRWNDRYSSVRDEMKSKLAAVSDEGSMTAVVNDWYPWHVRHKVTPMMGPLVAGYEQPG
jgi:hypothetical protein